VKVNNLNFEKIDYIDEHKVQILFDVSEMSKQILEKLYKYMNLLKSKLKVELEIDFKKASLKKSYEILEKKKKRERSKQILINVQQ
jgi:hypothetical protein